MDKALKPDLFAYSLTPAQPTDGSGVVIHAEGADRVHELPLTAFVEAYLRSWGFKDSERLHALVHTVVTQVQSHADPEYPDRVNAIAWMQMQMDAWLQHCVGISSDDPHRIQRLAAARTALGTLRTHPDFSCSVLAAQPSEAFVARLRNAALWSATPSERPMTMPTQPIVFWPWH